MYTESNKATSETVSYDEGLRAHMLGVYNRLMGTLLLTGFMAWLSTIEPLFSAIYTTNAKGVMTYTLLGWVVALAPIIVILVMGATGKSNSQGGSAFRLWSIAGLFGLSLGSILLVYTASSIFTTFFVTAAGFGVLSLIGYTTKKDLSGMGAALIMAVFGLIIAMIVNMFLQNSDMDMIISGIGVIVFSGLVAYDTQKIKLAYDQGDPVIERNNGALELYLDFINLFLFLLRFLGVKKD